MLSEYDHLKMEISHTINSIIRQNTNSIHSHLLRRPRMHIIGVGDNGLRRLPLVQSDPGFLVELSEHMDEIIARKS